MVQCSSVQKQTVNGPARSFLRRYKWFLNRFKSSGVPCKTREPNVRQTWTSGSSAWSSSAVKHSLIQLSSMSSTCPLPLVSSSSPSSRPCSATALFCTMVAANKKDKVCVNHCVISAEWRKVKRQLHFSIIWFLPQSLATALGYSSASTSA